MKSIPIPLTKQPACCPWSCSSISWAARPERWRPFRELIEIPVLDEIARLKSVPGRIVSHADRLELELTEQINSIIPQVLKWQRIQDN